MGEKRLGCKMTSCGMCGGSIPPEATECPYCGEAVLSSRSTQGTLGRNRSMDLDKADTYTSESATTVAYRETGAAVARCEASKDVLDTMVMGAIEIAPCETIGILYGTTYSDSISILHAQPIQKAERYAISTNPDRISHQLLEEAERRATEYDLVGGYHSHPYFVQFGDPVEGLSLSEADVDFLTYAPQLKTELVVGVFPIQIWEMSFEGGEWREQAARVKRPRGGTSQVNLLVKDIDTVIPYARLAEAYQESFEYAKVHSPGHLSMIAKEWQNIERIGDINGLRSIVAAYSNRAEVTEPIPLKLGYHPVASNCPECGAPVYGGERECVYCGTVF